MFCVMFIGTSGFTERRTQFQTIYIYILTVLEYGVKHLSVLLFGLLVIPWIEIRTIYILQVFCLWRSDVKCVNKLLQLLLYIKHIYGVLFRSLVVTLSL